MKILLINGPNLDRLGSRQPEIYGSTTLPEIIVQLEKSTAAAGATLEHFQSADSALLVEKISTSAADALIINPASLTHHDRSLAEAVEAFEGPVIEVHISNIHRREPYRRRSLISSVATGSIVGLGVDGYALALQTLLREAAHEGKA